MMESTTAASTNRHDPIVAQGDDLGSAYMAHRTDLVAATAAEGMLSRVLQRRAATRDTAAPGGAKQPPATGATTTAEGGEKPDGQQPGTGGQPAGTPGAAPVEAAAKGGVIAGAVAAGKDFIRGVIETPRALFKGARNAAQETLDLADDAADWLDDHIPLGGIHVGTDGVDFLNSEELRDARTVLETELPDLNEPQSVTGQMVRGVTQFLAGFAGAGKLRMFKALEPASKAGRFAKASAQGAVADFVVFDEHEARLSDLVQQFSALQNPVTAYLASDPTDSTAEGRFKMAVEGVLGGTLTEGVLRGLAVMRQARKARGQTPLKPAEEAAHQPDAFGAWSDLVDGPPLITSSEPARIVRGRKLDEAMREVAGGPDDLVVKQPRRVEINFARIEAPEDIKEVLQALADRNAPTIDQARRGVRTFGDIKLGANEVNAWETLMQRRKGEPLNAEQSVAARQLWVSSARSLREVATAAASSPSEKNLYVFRKMMAVHHAVQKEVIAARTETARALASWRIPVGGAEEQLRHAQFALESAGGPEVTRELAQRVAALGRAGATRELDDFVEKSAMATTKDAVTEAWIMALLSGPKTHIVNTLSNASVIGMQIFERGVASRIGQALGDTGGVELGEATVQFFGVVEGFKDALRYAWKTAKTGETGFGMGKVEAPRQGAISSEALNLSSSGWVGRAVDGIGSLIRLPGRALAVEDEFFKSVAYRAELKAQALRQASREVHAGQVAPDQLKARIAELVDNPPEHIRIASVDQAMYSTFTNAPGKLAQSLSRLSNEYLAVKVLLPFVRTPANILKFVFERTPLAPLMQQVRADVAAGGARRDLALARMSTGTAIMLAGADMAMSGTVSGGGPVDPAQRQALARSGWQPYSVRVPESLFVVGEPQGLIEPGNIDLHARPEVRNADGSVSTVRSMSFNEDGVEILIPTVSDDGRILSDDDAIEAYESAGRHLGKFQSPEQATAYAKAVHDQQDAFYRTPNDARGARWYSYRRTDPLGMTLGMAADMVELMANSDYESLEGNDEALAVAIAASIGSNVTSKTYLSGISEFFEMMSDPKRYGQSFASRLAGSVVPTGVAEIARGVDPYMREVSGMLDAMRARTPGLSDNLPPRRDLWGRPVSYQSGLGKGYDAFSPIYSRGEKPEPIDTAIIENGINARMPPRTLSVDGVAVNLRARPEVYARYVELAGNEIKHPAWNMGAKDLLNAIVSGQHPLSQVYALRSDGPDGGKATMILDTINQFRALARQQLIEEFPDLRAELATKRTEKRRAKFPKVGGVGLTP